jgi:hypothetical protein
MVRFCIDINDAIGLRINVNISPIGWCINMLNSKGDQLHHRIALEAWFNNHHIIVKPRGLATWRLGYGSDTIDYEANVTLIQQEVQELFQKVSQAIKAR